MKTLFLVLPSYSHISNVLRGKLIEALIKKYRVVVITPYLDTEKALKDDHIRHPNLLFEKYDTEHPLFWGIFNKYIRHAFLREYDDWKLIRHWFYRESHPLLIRVLTKMGSVLPKRYFGPPLFTWLEKNLSLISPGAKKLIERYRPHLIITATPGYYLPEPEWIIAAKKMGIKTLAIDINFDNPHSQVKALRNTDFVFVMNPYMKQEMEKYNHYTPETVFTTGFLRFDHYFNDGKEEKLKTREEFLRSKNLDPKKKTIVYITQTPVTYPERREFIKELVRKKQEKEFTGDPNILVRLHPFDTWNPYEPYINIPGIHIERAGKHRIDDSKTKLYKVEMVKEDLLNLTETLMYGDVLINLASTMLMEGCIFDKPTVSIGFPERAYRLHEYEDIKEMVATANAPIVTSFDELVSRTNEYLRHPEHDREYRKDIVKNYIYFTDGLSWKRTTDTIDTIITTKIQ